MAAVPGFFRAVFAAAATGYGGDRVEVKGEHESSVGDAGGEGASRGANPALAPAAAAEPPIAAVRRDGGRDVTIPLLALIALLAIAFTVRHTVSATRD